MKKLLLVVCAMLFALSAFASPPMPFEQAVSAGGHAVALPALTAVRDHSTVPPDTPLAAARNTAYLMNANTATAYDTRSPAAYRGVNMTGHVIGWIGTEERYHRLL